MFLQKVHNLWTSSSFPPRFENGWKKYRLFFYSLDIKHEQLNNWITKKVQIWISCHDFWSFLSQDKTTSNYWSRAISSAAKCETNNREISLKLRFERELDLRSLTYTSESRVVGSELIGSITGEEGQNSLTEDLSMLPSLSLMTIIILVFH